MNSCDGRTCGCKNGCSQAETIIDVQKKLCDLLGLTVPPIEQNEDDE